jgi:hypothetical protein
VIRLYYNYYEDKNPARKKEIDLCLRKNLDNPLLNVVILECAKKPSYQFFFDQINRLSEPEDINIIANSDIFFDQTISLTSHLGRKQIYTLSRWECPRNNPDNATLYDRQDSQDTWIVRGKIEGVYGDFTLGTRGCDNRIAHEFQAAHYVVSNPSQSIKSYHVHASNVRNYTLRDAAVPPPYLTIPTSSLP